jgi:hypothetical protein
MGTFYMNGNDWTDGEQCNSLENLAAELTDAAYYVALRHERTDSWLDLRLDLWKALSDAVRRVVP